MFLLALLLGACSFSIKGPNPKRPVHLKPQCDQSARDKVIPDVVGGVSFALVPATLYLAVTSLHSGPACSGCASDRAGLLTVGLISAAVSGTYWAAVFVGARRTSRCRAAYQRHEGWAPGRPPTPR